MQAYNTKTSTTAEELSVMSSVIEPSHRQRPEKENIAAADLLKNGVYEVGTDRAASAACSDNFFIYAGSG